MRRRTKRQEASDPAGQIGRADMVAMLKQELRRYVGPDVSICKAAAEQGFFCRGFRRYSDAELRAKYEWLVRRNPKMDRNELEEMGNRWQLARQDFEDAEFACDVQQKIHDTCSGWDEFSNDDLARFYEEMTGRRFVVT